MQKRKKWSWDWTLVGIGFISLVLVANLMLGAIAIGMLTKSMGMGIIAWILFNVVWILFGMYLMTKDAAVD